MLKPLAQSLARFFPVPRFLPCDIRVATSTRSLVEAMSCKDVKRVGLNGDLRRGAAEQLTTFWKESVTRSAEFSHQTKQLHIYTQTVPGVLESKM
jgi:hypothetical protein